MESPTFLPFQTLFLRRGRGCSVQESGFPPSSPPLLLFSFMRKKTEGTTIAFSLLPCCRMQQKEVRVEPFFSTFSWAPFLYSVGDIEQPRLPLSLCAFEVERSSPLLLCSPPLPPVAGRSALFSSFICREEAFFSFP